MPVAHGRSDAAAAQAAVPAAQSSPPRVTGAVVVGVDGAPSSNAAVAWAAAEAAARRVPLHIVHCWTWQRVAPWSTAMDQMIVGDLERAGERIVTHCRSIARVHEDLQITTQVIEGNGADVLRRMAEDARLIVVGTHRLHAVGRTVLGSIGSTLVAHASSPVVVVSKPTTPVTGSALPEEEGRVIAGIAADDNDPDVLRFAFDHARRRGRPLQVVFCWRGDPFALDPQPPPDVARTWLAELIGGWREDYPDVDVSATVEHSHPVEGLTQAAGPQDLIVLGRRGPRSRFGGLLGSVSLGVLHHAACSVAVVPVGSTRS